MVKKKKFLQINLIPESHRTPLVPVSVDHALLAFLLLSCVLSGGLVYSTHQKAKRLTGNLATIQAQTSAANKQIDDLKGRITQQAAMSEKQQLVQQLVATRAPWSEMFKELSIVIPSHTWLTEMSAKNSSGALDITFRGETRSQATMADFYAALEKSLYFNKLLVRYSKASETDPRTYNFEFTSAGAIAAQRDPAAAPPAAEAKK